MKLDETPPWRSQITEYICEQSISNISNIVKAVLKDLLCRQSNFENNEQFLIVSRRKLNRKYLLQLLLFDIQRNYQLKYTKITVLLVAHISNCHSWKFKWQWDSVLSAKLH